VACKHRLLIRLMSRVVNAMDNGERTFEVTGVRHDDSSGLFEKVERGGHGGLRKRYCQLCTIDE
jgi:hypothetical protein